jgi:hypothetical protein
MYQNALKPSHHMNTMFIKREDYEYSPMLKISLLLFYYALLIKEHK